jgi:AcrR family transcriptional regulator
VNSDLSQHTASQQAAPPNIRRRGIRERILSAALDCFLSGGYEQTTIAQIRSASGVSNGALFHYFPAKEAIAEALYVDGIASFQAGLRAVLREPPRSWRAAVHAVIVHQLRWTEQNPGLAQFIYQRGHLDFVSPGGAELDALNRDLAAAFRRWLKAVIAAGEIRPTSMLMITAIVSGPAHAIARRWLAGQLEQPLTAYADELADAACAGLSGAPRPARGEPGTQPADIARGEVTIALRGPDGEVMRRGQATVVLAAP